MLREDKKEKNKKQKRKIIMGENVEKNYWRIKTDEVKKSWKHFWKMIFKKEIG
jgi:hypothetical protein